MRGAVSPLAQCLHAVVLS